MAKKTLKTREIVYAALFVGVTAVLGLIIIPIQPVPVTGQSMGPMLAGSVLGGKLGALSMVAFDLLAAAGAPVLSGGRGGLGILLGPTGGYIVSWPLAAFIIGKLVERSKTKTLAVYIGANIVGGVLVVYLIGALWLAIAQNLDLKTAFIEGALIFLPGDAVKVFVASWVARFFHRIHPCL